MLRTTRVPVILLVTITLTAATAIAAWNLTSNEYTNYTGAIGTLRTSVATYTTGANSNTIGKATITLLKKADNRLSKAAARISTPTTPKMVKRSLYALEDAAYYVRQAARLEPRKNTTFRTWASTTGAALSTEAKKLAVAAANYVMNNHTSKKATRKLLRVGGKTTKAGAKASLGKHAKAIALYNKAILILANAGLL
jgi:hypothetical protein